MSEPQQHRQAASNQGSAMQGLIRFVLCGTVGFILMLAAALWF